MIGRRGFLGTTGAFAAVAGRSSRQGAGTASDIGEEQLRFGVLSDIHITDRKQQPYFEKALRQLDAWKVEAVLACGDLADYGLKQQLELLAETWFKVFPGGKGRDGRTVTNLMHYGDHDMSVSYIDRDDAKALVPDDALRHASTIFQGDRKAIWEACFKEPWHPIEVKTVKGFPFVLYHFSRGTPDNPSGQNVPGMKEVLAKLVRLEDLTCMDRMPVTPRSSLPSIQILSHSVGMPIFALRRRCPSGKVHSPAFKCRRSAIARRLAVVRMPTAYQTVRRFRRTR